jgi:hypothetical protein
VEHGEGSRDVMQKNLARDVSGMRCFLLFGFELKKYVFEQKKKIN